MSWQIEYPVDLLTWNVNGKGSEGHAKRRDTIVPHVYHRLKPDIGFLQEVPIIEDNVTGRRDNWYLAGREHHGSHYKQHTKNPYHGGLVSNPNTCSPLEYVSLEGLVPERRESEGPIVPDYLALSDYSLRRMRSDIPPRVLAAKLVKKGMPFAQIVVTFHSIHNSATHEVRRQYIIDFFNLMCRLADREGCPVLIGADFNLNVGHWEPDVRRLFNGRDRNGRPLRNRVQVAPLYTPTTRRASKDLLDTFAVVLPDITYNPYGNIRLTYYTCTFGEPKAYYPFPREYSGNGDNTLEYTEDEKAQLPGQNILEKDVDHDPVVVSLKIQESRRQLFLGCWW